MVYRFVDKKLEGADKISGAAIKSYVKLTANELH